MAITPKPISAQMINSLERIEKRLERVETNEAEHRAEDSRRFDGVGKSISDGLDEVKRAVEKMGVELGRRIDAVQGDVDPLIAAKQKAEGYEEGFKDAKKPNPWALNIVPILITAIISGLGAWAVHDLTQISHPAATTTIQTGPVTSAPR